MSGGLNEFEAGLQDYHRLHLLKQGIARVWKIPAPVQPIGKMGKGGRFLAQARPRETVDFAGYFFADGPANVAGHTCAGGQALLHEAKDTGDKKGVYAGIFEPYQLTELQQADQAGALAFASIHSKHTQRYYFIPARVLHLLPLHWTQLEAAGCARDDLRWYEMVGTIL